MNCKHTTYTMFIKCRDQFGHLHCITCASIIPNDTIFTYLTIDELNESCKVYKSKYTCEHITNHLKTTNTKIV